MFEKDASHRRLQPTLFTSTCRLPDSWLHSRSARRLATPRGSRASSPWAEALTARRVGSRHSACRMSHLVELRLTAKSPASTTFAERASRLRLSPKAPRARCCAVLAGSRSSTPPRCTSRPGRCSRSAELAKSSLTSCVAALSEPDIAARSPRLVPPRSASLALSSKSAPSSDQDAFHRPSAPSPCRAGHFRACAWDHEEPATVSLLACWWLSPPRPGFRRFFTACARVPLDTCAAQLDPWSFDQDRTPLVDFCNQTNLRAPPRGPPDSRLFRAAEPALLALARVAGLALPRRVRAASLGFCARPKPRVSSLRCQPRFTGQGPRRLSSNRHCDEPLLRVARAQLYPDLLRSDTSCRETGAPSTGDFTTGVARLSRISTMPGAPGGGRHRCQLHLARRDPVKGQTHGLPRCLAFASRRLRDGHGEAEGRVLPTTAKRSGARRTPRCLRLMSRSPLGRGAEASLPRSSDGAFAFIRRRHRSYPQIVPNLGIKSSRLVRSSLNPMVLTDQWPRRSGGASDRSLSAGLRPTGVHFCRRVAVWAAAEAVTFTP